MRGIFVPSPAAAEPSPEPRPGESLFTHRGRSPGRSESMHRQGVVRHPSGLGWRRHVARTMPLMTVHRLCDTRRRPQHGGRRSRAAGPHARTLPESRSGSASPSLPICVQTYAPRPLVLTRQRRRTPEEPDCANERSECATPVGRFGAARLRFCRIGLEGHSHSGCARAWSVAMPANGSCDGAAQAQI